MYVAQPSTFVPPTRWELWYALVKIDEAWIEVVGFGVGLTAGRDGRHSWGSKHYAGDAVDLRTWTSSVSGKQLDKNTREVLIKACKQVIGPAFDLVDEGTHFHLEFHPKSFLTGGQI